LGYGHLLVKQEIDRLSERYLVQIDSVVEDQQLGTGGAVWNAMAALGLNEALVVNGDTFLDGNLDDMLAPLSLLDCNEEMIRMALVEVEDSARFGGVNLINGRVHSFIEKGLSQSRFINAGVYRLTEKIFASWAVGSNFSLESDIFTKFAAAGLISGCPINGRFIDIGVPEDYFKFCEMHKSH
jgi:D-glycero-alpha-D-manno-heptose 1-phosphate guanylyltransferase